MTGRIPPGIPALWVANDDHAPDFFAIDLGGNVLVKTPSPDEEDGQRDTTGIASSGTELFLSGGFPPNRLTKHDPNTGTQNVPSFAIPSQTSSGTGDLAFDTERNLLWRINLVDVLDPESPDPKKPRIIFWAALERINPAELDEQNPALGHQAFKVDLTTLPEGMKNLTLPRGVTYDTDKKNLLYVSLSKNNSKLDDVGGIVITVQIDAQAEPHFTGDIPIRKNEPIKFGGIPLGGLAYQPRAGTLSAETGKPAEEGTLWVGGVNDVVRHMTLSGELLATVAVPPQLLAASLVDGLEFVTGT